MTMHRYPLNSPEAMGHVIAMLLMSTHQMDELELETIHTLGVLPAIGLSTEQFYAIVHQYCSDLSDDADADGNIHLIDRERINQLLDDITDREKRLLICGVALDLSKADLHIDRIEMVLLTHILHYWNLTLDDIEAHFA